MHCCMYAQSAIQMLMYMRHQWRCRARPQSLFLNDDQHQ